MIRVVRVPYLVPHGTHINNRVPFRTLMGKTLTEYFLRYGSTTLIRRGLLYIFYDKNLKTFPHACRSSLLSFS